MIVGVSDYNLLLYSKTETVRGVELPFSGSKLSKLASEKRNNKELPILLILHLICIEFRLLWLRPVKVLVGDLTRLVGEMLRPERPGMRLSMGDMGLAPRTPTPSTGDRDW